jgi:hypothetical protein
MSEPTPHAHPLRVVLIYAVFASLWILLSDLATQWLLDAPAIVTRTSTLKGWTFVVVTSVLLYALLRQRGSVAQQAQAERLRALHLLAAIADSSSDAIFALDLNGRFILFNQASQRLTGQTQEQVLGRDETALFPPDVAARQMADNRQVIDSNATLNLQEEIPTPNGRRTFLTTKGPLHDSAGRVIGLYGISRDITELTQMQTDLRQQAEELRRRNDELERFNRATVGRELDMIRIKQQINEMAVRLGETQPYRLGFLDSAD